MFIINSSAYLKFKLYKSVVSICRLLGCERFFFCCCFFSWGKSQYYFSNDQMKVFVDFTYFVKLYIDGTVFPLRCTPFALLVCIFYLEWCVRTCVPFKVPTKWLLSCWRVFFWDRKSEWCVEMLDRVTRQLVAFEIRYTRAEAKQTLTVALWARWIWRTGKELTRASYLLLMMLVYKEGIVFSLLWYIPTPKNPKLYSTVKHLGNVPVT